MKKATKKKPNPQRLVPLTREQLEDQEDLALIKRDIARGGKTYTHSQVMKEIGRHDLANKIPRNR